MRSTMTSVHPYWVFLIIAEEKGWNIPQKKEVEVRKDYPKAKDWNRRNYIYCGKNKASFNRIPKEYQLLMRPLLGKVVAECEIAGIQKNVCWHRIEANGEISKYNYHYDDQECFLKESCLSVKELMIYGNGNTLYGWTITKLKVYDTPKKLSEFWTVKCTHNYKTCFDCKDKPNCIKTISRPFQSWGYVEDNQ